MSKILNKLKNSVAIGTTKASLAKADFNSIQISKSMSKGIQMFALAMAVMSLTLFGQCYAEVAQIGTIMAKIVNYVFTIFMYIGLLLLVYSIGQLIMAFKNEDADGKARATSVLVVSVVLITLKSIAIPILKALNIEGFNVDDINSGSDAPTK